MNSDMSATRSGLGRRYLTVLDLKTSSRALGPFLERPGNLTGPKSYFEASRRVGGVLTSYEVHFFSLADNFIAAFSKLLKLPSLMEKKTA